MDKIDSTIIKLVETLYNISSEEKNSLIKSLNTTNENDKKDILKILYKEYEKINKQLKELLKKIKVLDIEVREFNEKINLNEILNQID